jgi:DNA topoisomerase-1
MESDLDAVSNGEIQWVKVLNEFWDSFEKNVNEIKNLEISVVVDTITEKLAKRFIGENLTCPKCLKGNLKIKNSKFGIFVGCSLYPECNHIGQVLNSNSNDFNEENGDNMLSEDKEKLIGVDPVTNYDIFLKKGPYGYYLELQDKKIKRMAIPSNMQPSEINLEKASFLISMPRTIFEGVTLSIGKFGPYLKQGDAFYSVKEDIFTIDEIKAKEIIEKEKNKKNGVLIGVHPKTKENIVMKYGKYGPYLVYKNENYKIPKEHKDNLELDNAVLIIENNKK